MENKSILDQVLSSQRMNELSNFDPDDIIQELFDVLNEREEDIIVNRYGLTGEPKVTLEEIGKRYSVTRERVRQVENASLRRIREKYAETTLKTLEQMIRSILEEHAHMMSERRLISSLLNDDKTTEANTAKIRFILNELLHDRLVPVKESRDLYKSWSSEQAPWDTFHTSVSKLTDYLEDRKEPIALASLVDEARNRITFDESLAANFETIIVNFLDITKKIEENRFNEWGLSHWSAIRPKRMNDKIFLVMKREGKPLHFTQIAKKINDASFDQRIAYPATIHNELILDNKYVLVGRGIYALREWGYKPGVVLDVIREILRENNKPLTKEQIISEVLKNRLVKKSTIALALMNKKTFQKNTDGTYSLTAS